MPLATPRHEQIMAELETRLRVIDAAALPDSYRYSAGAVLRPADFDVKNLDKDRDFIIEILPGDDLPVQKTTGTQDREAEIWVLLSKFWRPSTGSVYTLTPPIFQTIQNDIIADFETAVQAWLDDKTGVNGVAFGTLMTELLVREVNRAPRVDEQFMWVQAEVRLTARYTKQRGQR